MVDTEDAEESTSQIDQSDVETADKCGSIDDVDYSEDSTQLEEWPHPVTHGRSTVHYNLQRNPQLSHKILEYQARN